MHTLDSAGSRRPSEDTLPPGDSTSACRHGVFELQGMHCGACAGIIESLVAGTPGVESVSVNAAARRMSLRWHPQRAPLSALQTRLRRAGYDLMPAPGHEPTEDGLVHPCAAAAQARRRHEARTLLWRLFVASFCGMQVMMLATPSYVAADGDLAPDLRTLLNWGQWLLCLPVMAFSSWPFVQSALSCLRIGRLSMDVPVALGLAVMFGVSSVATFLPQSPLGSDVYFDSLTMFLSFLLAGRWLEMRARHRSEQRVEQLLQDRPSTAWRLDDQGQVSEVAVEALRVGDRLRIAAGMAFPVDGLILRGTTEVSESLMTGESVALRREPGQQVLAGSLNLGAPVDVCATQVGAQTRLGQLMNLADMAAAQRPEQVRWADRWAGPFLWGVLALAAGAALFWSRLDPSRAAWVFVSVLIVTCPCALSLSVPAALLAATRAMAARGILLQRLGAIETMARLDTVLLDKTGTLTLESLKGRAIHCRDAGGSAETRRRAVLMRAASLAQWSAHPMAQALRAWAREEGASGASDQWREVRECPGQGVEGRDEAGEVWRLGRSSWVAGARDAPPFHPDLDLPGHAAHPLVAWGPLGQVQAVFEFEEALRPQAREAVQALDQLGIESRVLSGDADERVRRVADELGLGVESSGALPVHKLHRMEALQAGGHVVAMVGDGVNDAPVLARAQVSFAMGHGSSTSVARADAVVLSPSLMRIPESIAVSRLALRRVRQNLAWSLVYNVVSIPMALMGWLPPWAAGLGMALSSLVVVLNSQRPLNPFSGAPPSHSTPS